MVLQRKRSATRAPAAADSPKKKRKRGNTSKILNILLIAVLSAIVIGGCALLGYQIGEHIADNYLVENPQKAVAVEEEDAEYAQLLKYPPLKERRGIRRTIP